MDDANSGLLKRLCLKFELDKIERIMPIIGFLFEYYFICGIIMSGDRLKAPINTSTSKAQFAFSKSSRFASPKANTHAFGYEIPG